MVFIILTDLDNTLDLVPLSQSVSLDEVACCHQHCMPWLERYLRMKGISTNLGVHSLPCAFTIFNSENPPIPKIIENILISMVFLIGGRMGAPAQPPKSLKTCWFSWFSWEVGGHGGALPNPKNHWKDYAFHSCFGRCELMKTLAQLWNHWKHLVSIFFLGGAGWWGVTRAAAQPEKLLKT